MMEPELPPLATIPQDVLFPIFSYVTKTCILSWDSIEVLGRCCRISKVYYQFLEKHDEIWKNFCGDTELRNGMSWKNTARALSLLTYISGINAIKIEGDIFYIDYHLWPLHRTVLDLKLIALLKSTSNLSLQDIKVIKVPSIPDKTCNNTNNNTRLSSSPSGTIIVRPFREDELRQNSPSRGKLKKLLNYFNFKK